MQATCTMLIFYRVRQREGLFGADGHSVGQPRKGKEGSCLGKACCLARRIDCILQEKVTSMAGHEFNQIVYTKKLVGFINGDEATQPR